eukprot:13076300-Ditylum_brightwellii.AAC.1
MMIPKNKKIFAHCKHDRSITLKCRNYVPNALKVPWWWSQINYENNDKSYTKPKGCNLVTVILANDNKAGCCCGVCDCNKSVAVKGGVVLSVESTKGVLLFMAKS